jgi:putative transposase
MPRSARRVSATGSYHVVMSGNGKWRLFEDDLDHRTFLDLLAKRRVKWNVALLSWCLMDTHVHLILSCEVDDLSKMMQSLMTAFAKYINERTGRTGHVFEERFWSKPIESDAQLLEAIRYVHNNPASAGICPSADYRWGSYAEYAGFSWAECAADTSMVLEMLGGSEGFRRFCAMRERPVYNPYEGHMIPEAHLRQAVFTALGDEDPKGLGALERGKRDEAVRKLAKAGLTVAQISRTTGLGRWVIMSAMSHADDSQCGGARQAPQLRGEDLGCEDARDP